MPSLRAARFLEQALLWNLLIHLVAILTWPFLSSFRGLPGGAGPPMMLRARLSPITPGCAHGWFPWQPVVSLNRPDNHQSPSSAPAGSRAFRPSSPSSSTPRRASSPTDGRGRLGNAGMILARQAIENIADLPNLSPSRSGLITSAVAVGARSTSSALGWTWCLCFVVAAGKPGAGRLTLLTSPLTWGSRLAVGSVGSSCPNPYRPGPLNTCDKLLTVVGFVPL